MAARSDTDHTTGSGKVAITGRYDSKKDSFGVDAAYALDDNNTIYAYYGVTDERLLSAGLETGFTAFGRRSTVDLVYLPPRDAAKAKLSVRQGKMKMAAVLTAEKARDPKSISARYELDAKLSGVESLKMMFDARSKASRLKVSRKLDPKNKLEAEYNYHNPSSKSVSLTFTHQYSKLHTFGVTTNYGARKYTVEWDCRTDNGPWTVATSFPFNARYVYCFCALSFLRKRRSHVLFS